jgi:hypothetical protein
MRRKTAGPGQEADTQRRGMQRAPAIQSREMAKFCNECDSKLGIICQKAGAPIRRSANFVRKDIVNRIEKKEGE